MNEVGIQDEEVTKEEVALAEKLKSCCSPWGVERRSKIRESSSTILELGRVYLNKAIKSDGMLQKLTFVKCAALLYGARVRLGKILEDEEQAATASQMCREMYKSLLDVCPFVRNRGSDLLQVSNTVSQAFGKLRQKERIYILDKLGKLPDNLPTCERIDREKQKVQDIKLLLDHNTEYYVALMKYISEKCLQILDEPPCKFSLVGLGSLARAEVTLYSDFEHIILLEDAVCDLPDTENIREYFRWYSVIFQIIIIGIGETYIASVGVKSLNDLYSTDTSKNWFFDLYTPGGVSFDGRFPHSCKSPLGKQEPSEHKKHVLELIQPVSKMVTYLSEQEDLKNGYHLKDVLVRTRLVHGNLEIYKQFKEKAYPFIVIGDRDKEVQEQAKFVTENIQNPLTIEDLNDTEKIKNYFYRPISVLVACLGRICHKTTGSSLDFFPWFRKTVGNKEVVDAIEDFLHNLEYSVAVACETRLKMYSMAGRQRQTASHKDIFKLVSKKCVMVCLKTSVIATAMFDEIFKSKFGYQEFFHFFAKIARTAEIRSTSVVDAAFLDLFGFYEDAHEIYKMVEGENFAKNRATAQHYLTIGINRFGDTKETFFKVAESLVQNGGEMKLDNVVALVGIHSERKQHQKALQLIDEFERRKPDGSDLMKNPNYVWLKKLEAGILFKAKEWQKAIECSRNQLRENSDPSSQAYYLRVIAGANDSLGSKEASRQALSEAARVCLENIRTIPLQDNLQHAHDIFGLQTLGGWVEDVPLTLELLDVLQGSNLEGKNVPDEGLYEVYNDSLATSDSLQKNERKLLLTMIEYSKKNLAYRSGTYSASLGLILKSGISKFFDVAKHFREAPEEILLVPIVFKYLSFSLYKYLEVIHSGSYLEIGLDLLSVFPTFPKHFCHPALSENMRYLVNMIVTRKTTLKISAGTQSAMHARTGSDPSSRLYTSALNHYAELNIWESAAVFWRIINFPRGQWYLKQKTSKLLVHIVSISPFYNVIDYLYNHRIKFIKWHSFPAENQLMARYGVGVWSYANSRFDNSGKTFWKVIILSKIGSKLRQRSVEMLMFVILTKWGSKGYLISFDDMYVSNKKPKVAQLEYDFEDYYKFLKMTQQEIEATTEQENALFALLDDEN